MRIDMVRTQHPWLTMSTVTLVLMVLWSMFIAGGRRNPSFPSPDGSERAVLVAKVGHILPILDRHVPFSLEKRNGRWTFVLKNH
jgi:hypothetical protein